MDTIRKRKSSRVVFGQINKSRKKSNTQNVHQNAIDRSTSSSVEFNFALANSPSEAPWNDILNEYDTSSNICYHDSVAVAITTIQKEIPTDVESNSSITIERNERYSISSNMNINNEKSLSASSLCFLSTPSDVVNQAKTKPGLGVWKFDTRKRKKYCMLLYHMLPICSDNDIVRIYITLTGKRLEGGAAVRQCKDDQAYKLNPNMSARPELVMVGIIVKG